MNGLASVVDALTHQPTRPLKRTAPVKPIVERITLRLTAEQKAKVTANGGNAWVRGLIERAKEPR